MTGSSPRLAVFFANAGHTLTHLLMLLYPTVVLALEGRFGLSYGELMLLALPGTILYGAGALPAGWLGDRWSAEHMMVLFYLGSGAAALATGLATGPIGIAVGLGFLGLFGSIYYPVGIAWLVRNAENRGKVLGWNGIFGTVGVGIAPNVELAQEAGISVSNGIDVDELCRTSAAGVFAAGDVARHPNPYCAEPIRVEHWQNAQNQGAAAASAMLGGTEPFAEVPWFWSDQYDINLQMAGHPLHWDELVFRGDVEGRSFSAFYLDKGRLVAAVGFNRGKDVRGARALIEARLSPEPAVLSDESVDLRALAKQK